MATVAASSPFFIVGCPRSGTTLLRRLLAAHPRLAIPEESHFIPFMFDAYGDPASEAEARILADAILSLRWIRDWNCPIDRDALLGCRSFASVAANVFESYARHVGRPRWGDKTPQYVACIPLLSRLFPDARFIHIHRDPRDVTQSWIAAPFGPKNAYVAAAEWKRLVTAGRDAGQRLPLGSYVEIEYQALVSRVEPTMRLVCEFIGEDFDEAVLVPVARTGPRPIYRFWRPGNERTSERVAGEAVESTRSGRWRDTMSVRDRIIVESLAGREMQAFGYSTEGLDRHLGAIERIAWRLHSHAVETAVRINSYPTRDIVSMASQLTRARWWRATRR
jgi:hypothetical protein